MNQLPEILLLFVLVKARSIVSSRPNTLQLIDKPTQCFLSFRFHVELGLRHCHQHIVHQVLSSQHHFLILLQTLRHRVDCLLLDFCSFHYLHNTFFFSYGLKSQQRTVLLRVYQYL